MQSSHRIRHLIYWSSQSEKGKEQQQLYICPKDVSQGIFPLQSHPWMNAPHDTKGGAVSLHKKVPKRNLRQGSSIGKYLCFNKNFLITTGSSNEVWILFNQVSGNNSGFFSLLMICYNWTKCKTSVTGDYLISRQTLCESYWAKIQPPWWGV